MAVELMEAEASREKGQPHSDGVTTSQSLATTSSRSAGTWSTPAPHETRSLPAPPVIRSLPGPPTIRSFPGPPFSRSDPARPKILSLP
jgi:hypothetical protein